MGKSKAIKGALQAASRAMEKQERSGLGKRAAEIQLSGGPKSARDEAILAARDASKQGFLEPSKEKDVWYHGTNADIEKFKPGHRGAVFLSKDPSFADQYAPINKYTIDEQGNHIAGANIMPVYVQIKNPFDFENPDHINEIRKLTDIEKVLGGIRNGSWNTIESPEVQAAIKKAGFDSFYTAEAGKKNLGVFDPKRIKSAIGMGGHYDITDPDITKAEGGAVAPEVLGGGTGLRLAAGGEVHMAGGKLAKAAKATSKLKGRSELQAQAKALGLPASLPSKDIQRMLDLVESDPKTWTQEDYEFIRPQLAIHQDLRPGSAERVESIMSEGLKRGMVDYPESMESPGYSFSKKLESPDSYLFLRGGLKFKEPTSPWLAEGNVPMFRISPTEGQSLYEAIVSSAVKGEPKKAEGGEVHMAPGGDPAQIQAQLAAGVPVFMSKGPEGAIARKMLEDEEAARQREEAERQAKVQALPFMDKLRGAGEVAQTIQNIFGQELVKPFRMLAGGEESIKAAEERTPIPETEAGEYYLGKTLEFLDPIGRAFEAAKIPEVPVLPEFGFRYFPGIGQQLGQIAGKTAKRIDQAIPQQLKDLPIGMSIKPVNPEGEKLTVNQLIAKLEAGEELTPEQRQKAEYSKAQKEKYAQANVARQAKEPPPKEEKVKVPASDLGFYSPIEKALANTTRTEGSGQDFINDIMKFNPSSGELEGTGVIDWLKTQDKVTKQDVQDYLNGNKIEISEVIRGTVLNDYDRHKFNEINRYISQGKLNLITPEEEQWFEATRAKLNEYKQPRYEREGLMLPGGENYREITLSLPKVKNAPVDSGKSAATQLFEREMMEKYGGQDFPSVYQKLTPNEIDKYDMYVRDDINSRKTDSMLQDKRNNFQSSHFPEKNILAHMRMQDMEFGDKRTLVIEEIQSDWHQAGRTTGYAPKDLSKVELEAAINTSADKPYYEIRTKEGQFVANIVDVPVQEGNEKLAVTKGFEFLKERGIPGAPPDAPYKKDWYNLAIKRLMKYAADNDYDQIALVGPEEQIRRGSLGTYVDGLTFQKNKDGSIKLEAEKGKSVILDKTVKPEDLELYVGKNVAKKILSTKDTDGTLTGDDLMIGGEGMRQYYGRSYPDAINRIGKQYNANIEKREHILKEFGPNDVDELPTGEYDRYGREIIAYGVVNRENDKDFLSYEYSFEKALSEANKKAERTSIWFMDLPKKLKEDVKIGQSYKKGGLVEDHSANFEESKWFQERKMARAGLVEKIAKVGKKVAGKRMSREEAEKAGLWHPISETKLAKPVGEYKATIVEDPGTEMTPKKTITVEELQGGVAIPLAGDRAAAGRIIKEIEGIPMDVTLEGGPDFMRLHPGAAWASGKGVLSMLADRIRMARESGQPIYGVYTAMSPQAVDFNTMMTESLLNRMDISDLRKSDIKDFNQAVRAVKGQGGKPKAPNFPGIDDPEIREKLLAGPGGQRDAFVKTMSKAGFQKKGFPDVAASRLAVTELELLNIPRGSSGYTIAELDPAGTIMEQSGHKTYPLDIMGEYVGGLETQLPVETMYPTHFEAKRLMGSDPTGAHKSLELFAPLQYLDQQWLDNAMQYLELQKKLQGRKKGGLAAMDM